MSELPPGYVNVGGAAIDVEELRSFTTNITRFLRTLPVALEISSLKAGSKAWCERLESLDPRTFDAVYETLRELGKINQTLAKRLREGRR